MNISLLTFGEIYTKTFFGFSSLSWLQEMSLAS